MTTVASIHELPVAKPNDSYVGEAVVHEHGDGNTVIVTLSSSAASSGGATSARPNGDSMAGTRVTAQMAACLPHRFKKGDRVLLIGKGGAYYVVALSKSQGKTTLAVDGDARVASEDGCLELVGDKGIGLTAPQVRVHASDRFGMEAHRIHHTSTTTTRDIDGMFRLATRDADTVASAGWYTRAENVVMKVKNAFRFRGKSVHLG